MLQHWENWLCSIVLCCYVGNIPISKQAKQNKTKITNPRQTKITIMCSSNSNKQTTQVGCCCKPVAQPVPATSCSCEQGSCTKATRCCISIAQAANGKCCVTIKCTCDDCSKCCADGKCSNGGNCCGNKSSCICADCSSSCLDGKCPNCGKSCTTETGCC